MKRLLVVLVLIMILLPIAAASVAAQDRAAQTWYSGEPHEGIATISVQVWASKWVEQDCGVYVASAMAERKTKGAESGSPSNTNKVMMDEGLFWMCLKTNEMSAAAQSLNRQNQK